MEGADAVTGAADGDGVSGAAGVARGASALPFTGTGALEPIAVQPWRASVAVANTMLRRTMFMIGLPSIAWAISNRCGP
jgi:hypothetical protein